MRAMISKRALLGGAVVTFAAGRGLAGPLDGVTISSVKVDVFPLRDNGSGPIADWVAADLPGFLRQAFAPHWSSGRTGATLHARIRLVTIAVGSPPQQRGSFFSFGGDNDNIDGEVWLVDSRGRELARNTELAIAPAPYEGIGDLALTQRRVAVLCQQFAIWAPGRLGY